jgi:hypothetical protein
MQPHFSQGAGILFGLAISFRLRLSFDGVALAVLLAIRASFKTNDRTYCASSIARYSPCWQRHRYTVVRTNYSPGQSAYIPNCGPAR